MHGRAGSVGSSAIGRRSAGAGSTWARGVEAALHFAAVDGQMAGVGDSPGRNLLGESWPDQWTFERKRSYGLTLEIGGSPGALASTDATVFLLGGIRLAQVELTNRFNGCMLPAGCGPSDFRFGNGCARPEPPGIHLRRRRGEGAGQGAGTAHRSQPHALLQRAVDRPVHGVGRHGPHGSGRGGDGVEGGRGVAGEVGGTEAHHCPVPVDAFARPQCGPGPGIDAVPAVPAGQAEVLHRGRRVVCQRCLTRPMAVWGRPSVVPSEMSGMLARASGVSLNRRRAPARRCPGPPALPGFEHPGDGPSPSPDIEHGCRRAPARWAPPRRRRRAAKTFQLKRANRPP